MRTQTKIILFFSTACFSIVSLLGISVYYFSNRYTFDDYYARLKLRSVVAARSTLEDEAGKAQAFREMKEQHLENLPGQMEYFFKLLPTHEFGQAAAGLKLPPEFFSEVLEKGTAIAKKGDTFFSGIIYHSRVGDYLVIVSASNYFNLQRQAYLRNLLFIAIPLASLLALIISIMFAKRVLGPVKQITDQVKEISAHSMHQRLPGPASHDEVGELAITFNNMLDRLETAFETQNNFISNASHELGTPLTAIIGETEVALSRQRTAEEYAGSLAVVLNEAGRLENIIRSLLFLAQTGFDGKAQAMGLLRTDELLWEVKQTLDRMNPQNKVMIDLSLMPEHPDKLMVNGNAQLLHLALSNIIGNACKYSDNQAVKVAIGTSDSHVIIVVKDTGIGIPEQELRFIYDPFFRASNTHPYKGYGIGLPLARNIIRLHKGSIDVSSVVGKGTTIQLNLPAYS